MQTYDKLTTNQRLAELGTDTSQLTEIMFTAIKDVVHVDDPKPVANPTPVANGATSVTPPSQLVIHMKGLEPSVNELCIFLSEGKISAIKQYRARTGQMLKESKEAIELAVAKLGLKDHYSKGQAQKLSDERLASLGDMIKVIDRIDKDSAYSVPMHLTSLDRDLLRTAKSRLDTDPIPF